MVEVNGVGATVSIAINYNTHRRSARKSPGLPRSLTARDTFAFEAQRLLIDAYQTLKGAGK